MEARVFLDANVLFSAAYREDSGLSRLWRLDGVNLMSSHYAVEEARRNLGDRAARLRLEALCQTLTLIPGGPGTARLPAGVVLPEDDRPILEAALALGATHLLSGDRRAFRRYYGQRVGDLLVLRPGAFLREWSRVGDPR